MTEAIAESYRACSADLIRFAASVVGPSDAEDIVSSAVVNVLNSKASSVDDWRRYLYRAVLNAGRTHLRGTGRRERRERFVAPLEAVHAGEIDLDMRRALSGLSPQQRAVIHLTYWEDLTPAMVASRLGVSDGTVRRQLARARQRLSEVLDVH